MPTPLKTPIPNSATLSIQYFNGRIVSAEDLNAQLTSDRTTRALIGEAAGSGIVRGFEVSEAPGVRSAAAPVLLVKAGLAINRRGHPLLLAADTALSLTIPVDTPVVEGKLFEACTPPQGGAYIAAGGAYVLVVQPVTKPDGLASVAGLGNVASACNVRFQLDAVSFRVIQLDIPLNDVPGPELFRNVIAYRCFSRGRVSDSVVRPFTQQPVSSALDALRPDRLTNCDVPLCVFYWTATGGLQFVDQWPARRRVTHSTVAQIPGLSDDSIPAEGQAMIWQFAEHVENILRLDPSPQSLRAADRFRILPPAGLLPVAVPGGVGFDPIRFFSQMTRAFASPSGDNPLYIEGSRVRDLLDRAALYPPISVTGDEMIWMYWVRENVQAFETGTPVTPPYVVFANGQMPYMGEGRYNLSRWSFSNFY